MTDPAPHVTVDDFGEFTPLAVLGEGGSGTVYRARWGHREVALKVMRAELPPSERDRFLTEARLLMEITHPGVVKVLAAGSLPDGRPYLAMEILHGESLATRLSRAPLALTDAVALFVQLADAVAAMHARGLLHRDLKPENIMLVRADDREHAVLLDFGIARAMDAGEVAPTQTGIVRGTPAYMAPERFFGQPATVATDVYELAVTLFAMIAGRLPWTDCIDPEVRLNPTRLADVVTVPAALDAELARALSTRAANRPPTALALRDAVVVATGGLAASARRTADVAPLALARTVAVQETPARPSPLAMPAWTGGASASVTTGNAAGERPATGVTVARRRRWPWAAAVVAVAGAAVALPLALRDDDRATHPRRTDPDDPWATSTTTAAPTGPAQPASPLSSDERAALRAELADAARYHADDLRTVAGIGLAELRAHPQLGPALREGARGFTMRSFLSLVVGTCDVDLLGRARWAVLGVDPASDFDVVARGDWTRDEIERCLMASRTGELRRVEGPGGPDVISVLPDDGGASRLVGWIDDHTFITSTRAKADLDFIRDRLAGKQPATPSALSLLVDGLDRSATVWLAGNRDGVDNVIETPVMRGAELSARIALIDDSADFAVTLRYRDAAAAEAARAHIDRQLAILTGGGALAEAVPGFAITRDGASVGVVGQLPPALMGSLREQLAQ